MKKYAGVLLAGLLLAGCAPVGDAPAEEPAAPAEPETSTIEEFASVVSRYSEPWAEVIEKGGECRIEWTLNPESIEGMTCYLREQTAHTSADLALTRFEELTPPAAQEDLVDETTRILTMIKDVDLKGLCGGGSIPSGTEECNQALGALNTSWAFLAESLSAWQPYL